MKDKVISIVPKILREAEISELLDEIIKSDGIKNKEFTGVAVLLVKDAEEDCSIEINIAGMKGLDFIAILEITKRMALNSMGW